MSSTHEQILEKSGKEEPTMKQASTIIGKYKDLTLQEYAYLLCIILILLVLPTTLIVGMQVS